MSPFSPSCPDATGHRQKPCCLSQWLAHDTRVARQALQAIPFAEAIIEDRLTPPEEIAFLHAAHHLRQGLTLALDATADPDLTAFAGDLEALFEGDQDLAQRDPYTEGRCPRADVMADVLVRQAQAQAQENPRSLIGYIYAFWSFLARRPGRKRRHETNRQFLQALDALDIDRAQAPAMIDGAMAGLAGIEQILWALSREFATGGRHAA